MADKLKKSKTKPRSQRSIEEEQRREEAIRKHEEEMEKSRTARRSTLSTIFCWYALVSSIFSVFLGFWGIFSLMAIGFGIAGERIAKDLDPDAIVVNDLVQAVDEARKYAQQGDVILLSPSTSSFDQYSGYEERGRHFKQIVNSL